MGTKENLDQISSLVAYARMQIEVSNSIHFFDLNTAAEDFFKHLLNKSKRLKLDNINIEEPNVAAINLGDVNSKIAVQITSDNTSTKIIETISKFNEKKLDAVYNKLIIFLIKGKKSYTAKFPDCKASVRLMDCGDLVNEIRSLEPEEIDSISRFLHDELGSMSKSIFGTKKRKIEFDLPNDDELEKIVWENFQSIVPIHQGNKIPWSSIETLIFELLKNAVIRSESKKTVLEVEQSFVSISYDGTSFNPWNLLVSEIKRGGYNAFKNYVQTLSTSLTLNYSYADGKNQITISKAKSAFESDAFNPCMVHLFSNERKEAQVDCDNRCLKKFFRVRPYEYHSSNAHGRFEGVIEKIGQPYSEIVLFVPEGKAFVDKEIHEKFPGILIEHYTWFR